MFRSLLGAMFITFAFVCSVSAQISATGNSYQARNTSSRQQNTSSLSILDNFSRTVAPAALSNIRNSETAFCYTVTSASGNYTGYTLDGYAVTGFCGILQENLKNILVQQLFATADNVNFAQQETCRQNPRIMLRFVRGVDYTDVLISAPCYVMSVFYAGEVSTFNFSSVSPIFDAIVSEFEKSRMDFSSPAAANQVIPVALTFESVAASSSSQSREFFGSSTQDKASQKKSGWNNLR